MTKEEAAKKLQEMTVSEQEAIAFMNRCKMFPNDYKLLKPSKENHYEFEFMKNNEAYKVIISNIGCFLISDKGKEDLSLWYYLSLANQRKDKDFTNLVDTLYQTEIDNLITKYYNKSVVNNNKESQR